MEITYLVQLACFSALSYSEKNKFPWIWLCLWLRLLPAATYNGDLHQKSNHCHKSLGQRGQNPAEATHRSRLSEIGPSLYSSVLIKIYSTMARIRKCQWRPLCPSPSPGPAIVVPQETKAPGCGEQEQGRMETGGRGAGGVWALHSSLGLGEFLATSHTSNSIWNPGDFPTLFVFLFVFPWNLSLNSPFVNSLTN